MSILNETKTKTRSNCALIHENKTCLFLFFETKGTKIDLRDDRETLSALSEQGLSPLKREQGQKLANKIRAVKYMECSALTQRGLKQVWPTILNKIYILLKMLMLVKQSH